MCLTCFTLAFSCCCQVFEVADVFFDRVAVVAVVTWRNNSIVDLLGKRVFNNLVICIDLAMQLLINIKKVFPHLREELILAMLLAKLIT